MKRQFGLAVLSCALLLFTGCAAQETPVNTQSGEEKTYTAEGASMEGSYTVTVTVDGSDIKDVSVDAHFPETLPEVFRQQGIEAVNATAASVVEHNAPTADMITGATVTCQAVLDGVSQCLDQAGLPCGRRCTDYDRRILRKQCDGSGKQHLRKMAGSVLSSYHKSDMCGGRRHYNGRQRRCLSDGYGSDSAAVSWKQL